jgi:hypothetical protein
VLATWSAGDEKLQVAITFQRCAVSWIHFGHGCSPLLLRHLVAVTNMVGRQLFHTFVVSIAEMKECNYSGAFSLAACGGPRGNKRDSGDTPITPSKGRRPSALPAEELRGPRGYKRDSGDAPVTPSLLVTQTALQRAAPSALLLLG